MSPPFEGRSQDAGMLCEPASIEKGASKQGELEMGLLHLAALASGILNPC